MAVYLITFTLLIGAVLLLRTVFRKIISPRGIYALWLVVVLRLCLPVSLYSVAMPELSWMREDARNQMELPAETEAPAPETAESNVADIWKESPSNVPYETIPPTTVFPVTPVLPSAAETQSPAPLTQPALPETEVEIARELDIGKILFRIWAIGAALLGLWFGITGALFRYRLYRDRTLYRTLHKTKVYVSSSAGAPCLAGIVPAIYITPETAEDPNRDLVILHEETHLRHGDHIWSLIRMLALIVHWYNPLVWAAALISKQDAELACDDAVASRLTEQKRIAYARILLDTVPQKHRYAVGLGSAPIKERILMLTKSRKYRRSAAILAILLAVCAVGCSFGTVRDNPMEEPDRTVTVELLDEAGLAELPEDAGSAGIVFIRNEQGIPTYHLYCQTNDLTLYTVNQSDGKNHAYAIHLPESYKNGRILYGAYNFGNHEIDFLLSVETNGKTEYLSFHLAADYSTDPVIDFSSAIASTVTLSEVEKTLEPYSPQLPARESTVEVVDGLPFDEASARVTGSPVGGNPKYYVFDESLTYYRYEQWSNTYHKCTLTLPYGYTDGWIISAQSGAGSGEVELLVQATREDGEKTCFSYFFYSGEDNEKSLHPKTVSVLSDVRLKAVNKELNLQTFPIYRCDDVNILDSTQTYGTGYVCVPAILSDYRVKNAKVLRCDDRCDPTDILSRAFWGYGPAWRIDQYEEFKKSDGWAFDTRRYVYEVPEDIRADMEKQGAPESVMYPRDYLYLLTIDKSHYVYLHLVPKDAESQRPANEVELVNALVRETDAALSFEDGGMSLFDMAVTPITGKFSSTVRIAYESDELLVFYGNYGVFAYDLKAEKMLFSFDFEKTFGIRGEMHEKYGHRVQVSKDGTTAFVTHLDLNNPDYHPVNYSINLAAQSYRSVSYAPLTDPFDPTDAVGTIQPDFLENLAYVRGTDVWYLFGEGKVETVTPNENLSSQIPCVGFVESADSDTIDVYRKGGAKIAEIPWDIIGEFPASDRTDPAWKPGELKADIYYGEIGDFRWAVVAAPPSLGSGSTGIGTSRDGGKTWQITSGAAFSGYTIGASFVSEKVGFLIQRNYTEEESEMLHTTDGGVTWNTIVLPMSNLFDGTPRQYTMPTFDGNNGVLTVKIHLPDKQEDTRRYVSVDGGFTWSWDQTGRETYVLTSTDTAEAHLVPASVYGTKSGDMMAYTRYDGDLNAYVTEIGPGNEDSFYVTFGRTSTYRAPGDFDAYVTCRVTASNGKIVSVEGRETFTKEQVLTVGKPLALLPNGQYPTSASNSDGRLMSRLITVDGENITISSYITATDSGGTYEGTYRLEPTTGIFTATLTYRYYDGAGNPAQSEPKRLTGKLYEYGGFAHFICEASELNDITPNDPLPITFAVDNATEKAILAAYEKATEAAAWFRIASLSEQHWQSERTVDVTDRITVEGRECYRITAFESYDAFVKYLRTLFSEQIVQEFLEDKTILYTEHDGKLYASLGLRGTNIFMGEETYEIVKDSETEYRLFVRVAMQGMDALTPIGYETYAFPCELRDGFWVFTSFPGYR